MQKLIKLSDEHYIGIDDSEIKDYGTWFYNLETKLVGQYFQGEIENYWKKITHSTQPFKEFAPKTINDMGIGYIPLSEVEEAIYGYSVDSICEKEFNIKHPSDETKWKKSLWKDGFKAHQELVKDKLFTIEDMKSIFIHGKQLGLTIAANIRNGSEKPNQDEWFNESIESLLPKTEWDVKINEQGKIKLIN